MKRLILPITCSALLLSGCNSEWKDHVENAEEAIKNEDYELAIEKLELALQEKDSKDTRKLLKEANKLQNEKEYQLKQQMKEEQEVKDIEEYFEGMEEPKKTVAKITFDTLKTDYAPTPQDLDLTVTYDEGLIYITSLSRDAATVEGVKKFVFEDMVDILEQVRMIEGINALTLDFQYDFNGNEEERNRLAMLRFDNLSSLPQSIGVNNIISLANTSLIHPSINDRIKKKG